MGAIIQVVQVTKTDAFQTAAGVWTAVPGLSLAITPSSVLNQIILLMKLNLASDGSSGVAYKLQRNGADIDIGDALGVRTQASGVSFGTVAAVDSGMSVNETFLDSPASVAAVTYDVYVFRGASANVSVNRANAATDSANFYRTTSNLILMEFQP